MEAASRLYSHGDDPIEKSARTIVSGRNPPLFRLRAQHLARRLDVLSVHEDLIRTHPAGLSERSRGAAGDAVGALDVGGAQERDDQLGLRLGRHDVEDYRLFHDPEYRR